MRLTRREREALREFVEACKEKFGGIWFPLFFLVRGLRVMRGGIVIMIC
jgi:hypothetical protein